MGCCASCDQKPKTLYRPRRPEKTVLHQVIKKNYRSWLALKSESTPKYLREEFEAFLQCGILSNGFAIGKCTSCDSEFVLGFSCKCRGICPSCNQKDMVSTAEHLLHHVIPAIGIRQWVISFPKRIRYYLENNTDDSPLNRILKIVNHEIQKCIVRCTKSISEGQSGAVSFVHRFGNSLNHHIHFHILATDGLFFLDEEKNLKFEEGRIPTEEIAKPEEFIRVRVLKLFQKRGLFDKKSVETMLQYEHSGFSLHADVKIEDWDTEGLRKLIRYCSRPPFASENLRLQKGLLTYQLPKPNHEGMLQIQLPQEEFLERISKFIPPPKKHRRHYSGVFAPNSPFRKMIRKLTEKTLESIEQIKKTKEKIRECSRPAGR